MDYSLWGHLPLLVRSNSKESVEFILRTLWRTRKTGLDPTDREIVRDMLQLPNQSDLDPLLVCLRILMRRCVYETSNKDEIQKLFPPEVSPELQRLLTLLLQKFQREWQVDALKDQLQPRAINGPIKLLAIVFLAGPIAAPPGATDRTIATATPTST